VYFTLKIDIVYKIYFRQICLYSNIYLYLLKLKIYTMRKTTFTCLLIVLTYCTLLAQPGTLDMSYNPGANATAYGILNAGPIVIQQPNGKIILATTQNLSGYSSNIIRLNMDGSIDTTFRFGAFQYGWIYALALQPDGKIIVGGDSVTRRNGDGSIDTTFIDFTANGGAVTLALQTDGKIIVGQYYSPIVRLNTNGSLDATFNTNIGSGMPSIAIQPADGKVIVGLQNNYGQPSDTIFRLNDNGSRDYTYNGVLPGGNNNNTVISTFLQPDGKLIVGGALPLFNDILRLDSIGKIDSTFNTQGTGFNGYVDAISLQSNGQIIAGGQFTSYNGISRNGIARLNSDGSLDNTFNPGSGFYISGNTAVAQSLVIQPSDGKIIAAGDFTFYDGTRRNSIARINGGIGTGVADINNTNSIISVYPNPSNGNFYFNGLKNENKIEVYDLLGQGVYSANTDSENYTVNLSGKEKGVYFYRITEQGNLVQQGKIVVE
jgi:uncharacterized delta-60 repeat protein